MWPYLILFLAPAYMALTSRKSVSEIQAIKFEANWPIRWKLIYVFIALMIGLRYEVGGDWYQYAENFQFYKNNTSESQVYQDLGLELINKISVFLGSDIYLLNFICGCIFTWGLVRFCLSQPLPWIALVSAVPYLITVVAMGYTRQSAAIGFAMCAMVSLSKGQKITFIFWLIIGCLFHKTCFILAPLAAIANTKNKFATLIWISTATIVLYIIFLQESVDFLIRGYVDASYQSSGAGIRIAMNAIPAIIFLILRKRFKLNDNQNIFWLSMAFASLLMVPMLLVSPSSTVVDRIGLYFIPIQLFVSSRLPFLLRYGGKVQITWVYIIVVYNFIVLLIWLIFADTSFAWLPYRFFPWELIVKAI